MRINWLQHSSFEHLIVRQTSETTKIYDALRELDQMTSKLTKGGYYWILKLKH